MVLRKLFLFLMVFALALTGCASINKQQNVQGTSEGIPTNPIESAGETPLPGAPLDTSGAGQSPAAAGTPQAVEAPFLAKSMIGSEVAGQGGRFGVVQGIVIDAKSGQGQYLMVQNAGPEVKKDILLPWGSFQLTLLAPDQIQQGSSNEPVIWLTVDDGVAAAAPETDSTALADPEKRPPDWDAQARQYWTGKVPEMPVTGGSNNDPQNIIFLSQGLFDKLDYKVRSTNGEAVGQMVNMVFNPDGKLSFGVVEFASLLDLGAQQVVVPWKLLNWDGSQRAFILNASDEELRSAPRFDANSLPDMTIPGWNQDWQRYWQQSGLKGTPAQTSAAPGNQVQVSKLMGSAVMDVNEQLLGQVADIILGKNGTIDYLVIQAEDKLRPVPWGDFEIGKPQDSLLYLDDVQRFLDAPAFAALEQINPATPGWDDQIRGYWGLGTK